MGETVQEVNTFQKQLPLHEEHLKHGARIGSFGEWLVPLYYTSILQEHETVRNNVGIFDISHMGEFRVSGPDASSALNRLIVNDLNKLVPGQGLYSPVCYDHGGVVDDVVVFKKTESDFLVVVNAGNREKDWSWFQQQLKGSVRLEDLSDEIALLAVQGPRSVDLLRGVFSFKSEMLSYYHYISFDSDFGPLMISETGYTGEKGYEIFCPMGQVGSLWRDLFSSGASLGLQPIGFGARDTLRLEAKFCLYGHDLNDETTPVEAGLSWTVGWDKACFNGKEVLVKQKTNGVSRKLVGFELLDKGIAREQYAIFAKGEKVGFVTSGTFSPTLKKNIGLGYVAIDASKVGTQLDVEIRGKQVPAQVVKTPFYKSPTKEG